MSRISVRSIWLQSMVCLFVLVGVVAGDITVAQARVAANHKRDAARKLHRAEAAYVAQVDAISGELFTTLQPVQNALDHLDASRPQYLDASRDAVVNSKTAAAVTKLDARVTKLRPTTTFTPQQAKLHAALQAMVKQLKTLEHGKKSNDPSDLLDEPYSGAAFALSQAEDDWQAQLAHLDAATRRTEAPSPGSIGSKRPATKLTASKASWIFSADSACESSSHVLYLLKEPSQSAPLGTVAKYEDKYAAIITKVNADLRKISLPRADQAYLRRTVYRSLKANDTLATSAHTLARALRARSINLVNQSEAQAHIASKGLSSLSHQMTSYGAEYCGWFFDPHGKSNSDKSGGSGSISA